MKAIFNFEYDSGAERARTLHAAGGSREQLINTIDATGGLVSNEDGTFGVMGDPDWLDLADAYVLACQELDLPIVVGEVVNFDGVSVPDPEEAFAERHGEPE
jgi:hypothetical protein